MKRNRRGGLTLQAKITATLLPALLPTLAVVGVTFSSARQSLLDAGKSTGRLIVQNGAREINAYLRLQDATFQDWVRKDVYGLAIEFDTHEQLGGTFTKMLDAAPAFNTLLLTDNEGNVIQAATAAGGDETSGLIGRVAKEVQQMDPDVRYTVTLDESELLSTVAERSVGTFSFAYRCRDSSGDPVGVLLAYLDWGQIQSRVSEVNRSLVENGIRGAETSLVDWGSALALAHSSRTTHRTHLALEPSTWQWLGQSENAGETERFEIEGAIRYATFAPILDASTLSSAEAEDWVSATSLVAFLPEDTILAGARGTLYVSLSIAAVSAALLLGLVWFVGTRIAKPIKQVIGGLGDSADRVDSAAAQVADSSRHVADGASEQASSLEETGAALGQMAATTRANAENAKQANELSGLAGTAAENGSQVVERLNDAMRAIRDSSGRISKIIKAIEEIAFQTNLLALNAAVEAARAGEHGKGFAVVADEVRSLAQRAAQAARETDGLIEDSINKANVGAEVATEVDDALGAIVGNVGKVDNLIQGIAKASEEQAEGVDQVSSTVSQMDRVTQQNAAGAKESSSASEELASQAQAVKDMVETLVGLVGSNAQKVHSTT